MAGYTGSLGIFSLLLFIIYLSNLWRINNAHFWVFHYSWLRSFQLIIIHLTNQIVISTNLTLVFLMISLGFEWYSTCDTTNILLWVDVLGRLLSVAHLWTSHTLHICFTLIRLNSSCLSCLNICILSAYWAILRLFLLVMRLIQARTAIICV